MVNNLVDEGDENDLCQRQEFMNSLMVMTKNHFSMSIHHTFCIYGILLTHMTY